MRTALIMMIALFSTAMSANELTITQSDKMFSHETLTVKVGDTVHFRNDDSVMHNIFSLSPTQSFDLGSYDKGTSKSVTFDSAGLVEIECALHPDMYLEVMVEE